MKSKYRIVAEYRPRVNQDLYSIERRDYLWFLSGQWRYVSGTSTFDRNYVEQLFQQLVTNGENTLGQRVVQESDFVKRW